MSIQITFSAFVPLKPSPTLDSEIVNDSVLKKSCKTPKIQSVIASKSFYSSRWKRFDSTKARTDSQLQTVSLEKSEKWNKHSIDMIRICFLFYKV